VTGFAGTDGPAQLRQPVELPDRQIAYHVIDDKTGQRRIDTVLLRRPATTAAPLVDDPQLELRSVAPAWQRQLIVGLSRGGSSSGYELATLDLDHPSAGLRKLFDDPNYEDVDAVTTAPRITPKGQISMLKPDSATGEVLVIDAGLTRGEDGRDTSVPAKRMRIYKVAPPTDGKPAEEMVSELDLAADGSLYTKVPANAPLRFQTLDDQGNVLRESRSWIWVRPAEIRGCIGCHEDPETAPPNRVPLVLKPQSKDDAAATH
jgi:hypothetical protein